MSVGGDSETTFFGGPIEPQERIGPYQLLQKIGEGGMGEVWVAEQREPIRRTVAVKVIKIGMDTRRVVARFEAERQALAVMDHPAIAKVLDAGATATGRPYFVMEYVKGERITDYCDRLRLPTAERLQLFARVCEGVHHAHQKGIIHRDLKPSNVLVTLQDAEAVPKIIDFGIAKATSQQLTDGTVYTELGVLIGTPEYMSPEQAEMTGLDIDTRTDVYSLGVLLYELLTGTVPFEPATLRGQTLDELRRVIREVDPPRPSTRVTQPGPSSGEAARRRMTEPARLAGQLRGDLDWITMRALEKDRTRRYGTAIELAADVRRYLRDEPVSAGPPSALYRAKKFVRRHRLAVAAGAVVVVLLAALGVMLAAYLVAGARHAAELRSALAAAQMEADKAEEVSRFLEGLFESNDPDYARGEEVTGRELLERGLRQANQLTGDPLLQAQLLATIARVYESLGQFAKARPLVERALQIRETGLGSDHPDAAQSRRRLGVLLRHLGDRAGAERELRRSLASDRARQPADPVALAADLHELGHTLVEQGRYEEGERLFREALDMRRALGSAHQDVADSLSGVAYARSRQGFPRDAVQLYGDALRINQQRLEENHPQLARSHQNLGVVLSDVGEYDEAERHFATALSIYRTAYGEQHPSIAVTINNLANLKARLGDLEAAERLFRETAEMRQAIYGEDHPATVRGFANLATTMGRRGKLAESERMFRQLIALRSRTAEPGDRELAVFRVNLSDVLRRLKRLEEAERVARQALDTESRAPKPSLEAANAMIALSRILSDRGRGTDAERYLRDGLAIRRERLGAEHPEVKRAEAELEALSARQAKTAK